MTLRFRSGAPRAKSGGGAEPAAGAATTTDAPLVGGRHRSLELPDSQGAIPGLTAFLTVAGLAAADGGYFATAWGWSALALLGLAGTALLVRSEIRLGRLEIGMLAAFAALTAWIALSIAWSDTVSQSVLELERAVAMLATVAAAVLVSRGRSGIPLLAGALTGITLISAYGLATRLFPERMGTYDPVAANRLAEPLGYWNALGIFAVMGIMLATGVAVRARRPALRALAAASLVILVPTLYFTFSRGAWIALAAGLVTAVAVDRRRLQYVTGLLLVTPAPALAVWLASRSTALSHAQPALAESSRDGRRLAFAIVVLAAISALAALAFFYAEARVRVNPPVRVSFAVVLVAAVVAGGASIFVAYGSPAAIARKAYDGFTAPPVPTTDLNERLFQLSGNGRAEWWAAAWDDFTSNPILGSGAGSYEQHWLRSRPNATEVRDAHGLYIETLAELGPLGLGLLLAALAIPIVAGIRARNAALVPVASGAYAAYLAHAGIDWDWEMAGVTAAALLCGTALLVAARGASTRPLAAPMRAGALVVVLALTAFSFVGLVGNSALAAGYDAFASGRSDEAEAQARKAARWAPWSSESWQLLGEVQLVEGQPALARTSFREAVARDEGNWELWFGLAQASAGNERKRAFARARVLNPLSGELAEYARVELAGRGARK